MEKKRIFVIDDDRDALESLQKLLLFANFEVDSTNDSRLAVEKIKHFQPHLILLDLLMPHLGGFEICQILNETPETSKIPIIIISALDNFTDIHRAYRLGVVGYFPKPYDFEQVLKEIQKAVSWEI